MMRGIRHRPVGTSEETPTGQSFLAYRVAAGLLLLNALIVLAQIQLLGLFGEWWLVLAPPAMVGLAVGLLLRKGWVCYLALTAAILGALVMTLVAFANGALFSAITNGVIHWGFAGAIMLLLTGESSPWRTAMAVGLYGVFNLMPNSLLLLMLSMGYVPI
jgi:hypothetical protein